jgi:hypothetical protein
MCDLLRRLDVLIDLGSGDSDEADRIRTASEILDPLMTPDERTMYILGARRPASWHTRKLDPLLIDGMPYELHSIMSEYYGSHRDDSDLEYAVLVPVATCLPTLSHGDSYDSLTCTSHGAACFVVIDEEGLWPLHDFAPPWNHSRAGG